MLNGILIYSMLLSIGGAFDPFHGPAPLVVLIQSDPWAMVIGSDTPRVAIYQTGEAIVGRDVGGRLVYHHAVLDKESLANVREHLTPLFALKDLKPAYNMAPSL